MSRSLAKRISNYNDDRSLGSRFRARRAGPLMALIESAHRTHGEVRILDIGGTERYWKIIPPDFLERHRVHVTIGNKLDRELPESHGRFAFIRADGCNLQEFEDDAFHIAHSNSVIEHVGDWTQMKRLAAEIRRVAESHFVQTPNYWFPVEPHCMTPFFHWLPKPLRIRLVMRFALGHWKRAETVDQAMRFIEGSRLLNRPMFEHLFEGDEIITERVFLLPKSFIAVGRARRGPAETGDPPRAD
ncbi:MAG: class I SAM-dependent methyltransferase [Xanthomonadales bacterium]|nr:class I SAM-dependent methyltransferase [Xanthomonadales bacterium]